MAVILPSVYKDGTATVAANGVAVTGQGTMWLNTVLPGDFFGTHKGSPNRILAVNSNTSLTLAYPWLGGAQATAAYEIMYQSDNARMLEAARQLLEKLSNGNVDALAGLAGGADKFPYFTGSGTMAQGDVTPFARTNVLNKTDRAALLVGIGVSPNANFVPILSTDLNQATNAGWHAGYTGLTANLPIADQVYVFTIPWTDGVACTQTGYLAYGTPRRQWSRDKSAAGVWSAWSEQRQNAEPTVRQGGIAGSQPADSVTLRLAWAAPSKLVAQANALELGEVWTAFGAPSGIGGGKGYQKFPSGIILQWGYVGSGNAVTYPVAFPTSAMAVLAQPFSLSNLNTMFSIGVATSTNNGATFTRQYVSPGPAGPAPSGETFSWLALGY